MPFGGYHVLNRDLHSFAFEYGASICVLTDLYEIPQDKEVRNLLGRDQPDQIEVEIGISCGGYEEAVAELRVGAVEVVLPCAPADR